MKHIVLLIYTLAGFVLGIMVNIYWKNRKKNEEKTIKDYQSKFSIDVSKEYLSHYVKEWEVCINTQMHFNDVIIKFRSIVLSVFIASIGFIYGISEKLQFTDSTKIKWFGLAMVFWLSCFILDYFYYHKLLLGAVKHAEKFDNNEVFQKIGLVGMTKTISLKITALRTQMTIWLFYLMPLISLMIFVYLKYIYLKNDYLPHISFITLINSSSL